MDEIWILEYVTADKIISRSFDSDSLVPWSHQNQHLVMHTGIVFCFFFCHLLYSAFLDSRVRLDFCANAFRR
uniref:Uncharacterized protein n=1 Tax=Arundo donax TaxID=35708 RepID=A0A0A8YQU6_ARUDO